LEKATDTVYKIGDYDANTHEAFMARKLRKKSTRSLGFELRIPETRTYRMPSLKFNGYTSRECVSAQEFAGTSRNTYCAAQDDWMTDIPPCNCKGRTNICFTTVHKRIVEFSDLSDIHGSNVLVDSNNVFWLIDLGC